ncbi:uncharacterized protein DUF1707 [Halopolyspora algeriensis]|uniref:Uncharacterized protein DUF1707 n=1 Tax=Halopolyspora algeriensis TaxID=1500506 RepID=A0A368VPT2_9ACTN|nr:DUF1707 domain-containing protein [Halopolyspora algeriensis]RCW43749.1 uncharacterized protein DUF1707 [Halopolyspora algeriensis]TQM47468.1 uncharacterized protein DUF1707 [Halopolyspora algeriensis]
MSENRRNPDVRIGDPERNQAISLLGEHFSAGRLDVQEFDERCARATSARFRSELVTLFEDLPAPRFADPTPQRNPGRGAGGTALVLSVLFAVLALALLVKQPLLAVLALAGLVFWLLHRRG